jgi:NitT/TauT family transport system substrate-binding protein
MLSVAMSALGLRLGGVQAQGKLEKSKLIVAVGDKTSLKHLPLTIADRLGFFAGEGLDIEILDLGTGQRAQQAVMEGAADVACGAFEGLFDPLARRHLLRAFLLVGRAPQIAFGVSKRNLPAFKRVQELRGRRIAVASPGSSAQLVAALVLARAGLSLADVRLVEARGVGAALQAVRSGQVDAIVHMEPVMTMLEQKGDIGIISDTRSLKGSLEVFGGAMPSACMFAPAQAVQNHVNTMQALANAVVHALKWLQTAGPSDLIKAVPEAYLLGDRGLYLAVFGKVRESIALDGVIPDDGVKTAIRVLRNLDPTFESEKIELERIYTNEFARKAKEKYRA